jgi:hypothetical protein
VWGSAGSLQPALPLGSVVVVTAAEREDGASYHYLPAGEAACADSAATEALVEAAREMGLSLATGRSWTMDALFRETAGAIECHRQSGVLVVGMEAAAIFAVAKVRCARAGVIVAVSDELFRPRNPGFHLPEYLDTLTRAADTTLLAAEQFAKDTGPGVYGPLCLRPLRRGGNPLLGRGQAVSRLCSLHASVDWQASWYRAADAGMTARSAGRGRRPDPLTSAAGTGTIRRDAPLC